MHTCLSSFPPRSSVMGMSKGFASCSVLSTAPAKPFTPDKGLLPLPGFSSLSGNDIGNIGCCHLSKALRAATTLEELG